MRVISTLLFLIFCSVGYAGGSCGWYLKGFGGVNYISCPSTEYADLKTKGGYAFGASCGYSFSRSFRLDAELTYRDNDLDQFLIKTPQGKLEIPVEGYIRGCTLMGNAVLDLPIGWLFHPYLGAGIGFHSDYGKFDFSKVDERLAYEMVSFRGNGMSYQALLGICLPVFGKADVRCEYRYLDDLIEDSSAKNHTLALTCQYVF